MKKLILLILSLVLVLSLASCGLFVKTGDITFEYELNEYGTGYNISNIKSYQHKSITIPSAYNGMPVTGIDAMFSWRITDVSIPYTIGYIYDCAFFSCENLESITVDPENTHFKSVDGNLYTKDGKEIVRYAASKKDASFAIPDGVEVIWEYAFHKCHYLTDLTIPDSVHSLGDFGRVCKISSLAPIYKFIKNENGIHYMDRWVVGCDDDVTTAILKDNTYGICTDAFYFCQNLREIKIPDSVCFVEKDAFSTSLPAVEEVDGVLYIDTWVIGFASKNYDTASIREGTVGIIEDNNLNANFKHLAIPASLKYISSNLFRFSLNIESVSVSKDNSYYKSVGGHLYTKDGKTLIHYAKGNKETDFTIPEGTETIAPYAFDNVNSLRHIQIPDSVTTIGENAFELCVNLSSISLGNGIKTIGKSAFLDCYYLRTVEIKDLAAWCGISFGDIDSNPLRGAEYIYVNGSQVYDIVIPDGVTEIKPYAFYILYPTAVTIPDSVSNICTSAFCYSRIYDLNINDTNEHYKLIDGNLYTKDGKTLVGYTEDKQSFTIPDGVEVIGGGAFSNSFLLSVTIPEGVRIIEDEAFAYCENIVSLAIPEGVIRLGDRAFYGCTSLSEIIIPGTLRYIGDIIDHESADSLNAVYFTGTYTDWWRLTDGHHHATDGKVYFYSESQPTTEGRYWYYISPGKPKAW